MFNNKIKNTAAAENNNTPSPKGPKMYSLKKLLKKSDGPDFMGVYHLSSISIRKGVLAVGFYENGKVSKIMLPQFTDPDPEIHDFDGMTLAYDATTDTMISISNHNLKTFIEENAKFSKANFPVMVWYPTLVAKPTYHLVKYDTSATVMF